MATTIVTRNSTTLGTAPTFLATGELAVNVADRAVWVGEAGVPKFLSQVTYMQPAADTPRSPKEGAFWWKTDTKRLMVYEDGEWRLAGAPLTTNIDIASPISVRDGANTVDVFATRGQFDEGGPGTGTDRDHTVTGVHKTDALYKLVPDLPGPIPQDPRQIVGHLPGTIAFYAVGITASTQAPAGWLTAQGQLLNVDDYPPLYEAIGRQFTEASQSTRKFRLPDLRGLFPRFYNDDRVDKWQEYERHTRQRHRTGSAAVGNKIGTLQPDAVTDHAHSGEVNTNVDDNLGPGNSIPFFNIGTLFFDEFVTTETGGTENRPKNVALWGLIKE